MKNQIKIYLYYSYFSRKWETRGQLVNRKNKVVGKNNRKRNRKAGKNWEIIRSGCGCGAFLRNGKGTNSPISVVISLLLTLFLQEKMFLYEEAENRMGFPE